VRADMPEARASRKRQIQVTPGPFGGAAPSSAALAPDSARLNSFRELISWAFNRRSSKDSRSKVAAIVRRDGDSTGPRSRHFQCTRIRNRYAAARLKANLRFGSAGTPDFDQSRG
jgi:hypothetical protein